jgi:hypothetical protein
VKESAMVSGFLECKHEVANIYACAFVVDGLNVR